jgi:hypothetical protein
MAGDRVLRLNRAWWAGNRLLRGVGVKLQVPPLRYPGFPVQEIQGSYGRDDKVEGGGPPWLEWRWMDRIEKLIRTALTLSRSLGTQLSTGGIHAESLDGRILNDFRAG